MAYGQTLRITSALKCRRSVLCLENIIDEKMYEVCLILLYCYVQDEKPRVGDIGDAEVNAKSYKVQLLRAERAIRSLSQRNELVESELCAMHALLR